jgi:hypothetical protein
MKAYRGRVGIGPFILKIGTKTEMNDQPHDLVPFE